MFAVGTKMPGWVDAAYAEYAKRLPRECSLQLTEIKRELIGDILTLFDDGLPREQTLALLGQVSVLIELVKRGQAQRVSP